MAIDMKSERVFGIRELARNVPGRPDRSTLYRWMTRGQRGVRLESVRIGKRLFTSMEAFERFVERLTDLDARDAAASPPTPARPRPNQRGSHASKAEADAVAEGL